MFKCLKIRGTADQTHLKTIEQRLLWLSHWMIHHANHVRPKVDGIKIGGHQASSAPMVSILTALYFHALRPVAHGSAAACHLADVEMRILSGESKPSTRIPTETDLMAPYGCSRMTVNKAIASLAKSGLVARNRRAGTVVAPPRMHAAGLNIARQVFRGDAVDLTARFGPSDI